MATKYEFFTNIRKRAMQTRGYTSYIRTISYFVARVMTVATILLVLTTPSGLASEVSCISSAGGYCVNLSAVAQARGTQDALDFLGGSEQSIGNLVANIYYFGIGLVAIAAFAMIVFGGFMYLTAGDNPGRIKQGQDYIKNALFGLVLALISWLILYTINPDLVNNLDLTITPIELQAPTVPAPTDTSVCASGTTFCTALQRCTTVSECTKHGIGVMCISDTSPDIMICEPSCSSGFHESGAICCLNGKSLTDNCR